MQADTLIADKAFDADERVIAPLAAAGKTAVIPPKANRRLPRDYDRYILPGASPHRELLRQTQAVSCHRHPLRQDRAQLPRRHPPDRRAYLAQLRTGPNLCRRRGHGNLHADRTARDEHSQFATAQRDSQAAPILAVQHDVGLASGRHRDVAGRRTAAFGARRPLLTLQQNRHSTEWWSSGLGLLRWVAVTYAMSRSRFAMARGVANDRRSRIALASGSSGLSVRLERKFDPVSLCSDTHCRRAGSSAHCF